MIIIERVAAAAFIAGCADPTRRSYATDLRIAEALGCSLATADHRLANEPGVRCKFDIV